MSRKEVLERDRARGHKDGQKPGGQPELDVIQMLISGTTSTYNPPSGDSEREKAYNEGYRDGKAGK